MFRNTVALSLIVQSLCGGAPITLFEDSTGEYGALKKMRLAVEKMHGQAKSGTYCPL